MYYTAFVSQVQVHECENLNAIYNNNKTQTNYISGIKTFYSFQAQNEGFLK